MRNSIKLNTILNSFRMMLTVLVPLVTFPYTSRIFLTEGYGQISFSNSVIQIFTLFASLGIYIYGIREGSKIRNDRKQFSKLAHELFCLNLVSTIIAYAVFFICLFNISSFFNYKKILLINSVAIAFTALGLDWIYGVYEEYRYITIRQVIAQIFIVLVMFLFIHKPEDIYLWVFLTVMASVGVNVFNLFYARKYIDYFNCHIDIYSLIRHLYPLFMLFFTQFASMMYSNIDTFLLGVEAEDHNVGLYSAAVKLNSVLITCFVAMTPVFMPRIVEYINNKSIEYYLFLKKIIRLIVSLGLPIVVGIELLADKLIVFLAGSAFYEAAVTVRFLAPIILITSIVNIFYYNIMVPNGDEKKVFFCTMFSALINLLVSLILIPYFYENGAAIGSLIAELSSFCLALLLCLKKDPNLKSCFPSVCSYVIGSIVIILCCFITNVFLSSFFLQLFLGIVLSVVGYIITLALFKDDLFLEVFFYLKKSLK